MNFNLSTIIRFNTFLLFILVVMIPQAYGHTIKHGVHLNQRNHDINEQMTIADPIPGLGTATEIINRKINVSLIYGREDLTDVDGDLWGYRVSYNLLSNNSVIETGTVQISKGQVEAVYQELNQFDVTADEIVLEITTIEASQDDFATTITDLTTIQTFIPADIRLELEMEVERYNDLNLSTVLNHAYTVDNANHELTVMWEYLPGVENYELEIAYVDDELIPGTAPTGEAIFRNALSIEITDNHFSFPVTYTKGTLYYRVRPISRHIAPNVQGDYTHRRYGSWTIGNGVTITDDVNYGGTTQLIAFQPNENWQYTTTFAEDGKYKKVISYFDEGLRNRQTQTNLSTEETTLVATSHYDVEGRPTLNILPVPAVDNNNLFYKPSFNKGISDDLSNPNNTSYNRTHFDKNFATQCVTNAPDRLDDGNGAGQYFSGSNSSAGIYRDFIPDAEGYPMTQMKYLNDGTGRISHQGGVGAFYQLGSGQETTYFYDDPSNMQLQRLFGSNVGDASFYKRNAVRDANGQMSISYIDAAGRVIATALAGEVPSNVNDLASAPSMAITETEDLLDHNTIDEDTGTSTTNTTFSNEILNNEVDFHYNFSATKAFASFINEMGDSEEFCFSCSYELDIQILDPCGAPVSTAGSGVTFPISYTGADICNDNFTQQTIDFSVILKDLGNYQINKILRVLPLSIEDLTILVDENTYDVDHYLQDVEIDPFDCTVTCEQYCRESLILGGNPTPSQTDIDMCMSAECNGTTYPFTNTPLDNGSQADCDAILFQIKNQIAPGGCLFEDDPTWWSGLPITEPFYIPAEGMSLDISDPIVQTALVTEDGWQDEWVDILEKYHPEYCAYILCRDSEASRMYDLQVVNDIHEEDFLPDSATETEFATAIAVLLITDPMFASAESFYLHHNDNLDLTPQQISDITAFFGSNSPAGVSLEMRTEMTTRLLNYGNCPTGGSTVNIFEFVNCHVVIDNPTSEDKWSMLYSLYLGIKYQYLAEIAAAWCPVQTDCPIMQENPLLPGDVDTEGEGQMFAEDNGPTDGTGAIEFNNSCEFACTQRAWEWYGELQIFCGITLSDSDRDDILIPALIELCGNNCDQTNNPLGYMLANDQNNQNDHSSAFVNAIANAIGFSAPNVNPYETCLDPNSPDFDNYFNTEIRVEWSSVYTTDINGDGQIDDLCNEIVNGCFKGVINDVLGEILTTNDVSNTINTPCLENIGYIINDDDNLIIQIPDGSDADFCCSNIQIEAPHQIIDYYDLTGFEDLRVEVQNGEEVILITIITGTGASTKIYHAEVSCSNADVPSDSPADFLCVTGCLIRPIYPIDEEEIFNDCMQELLLQANYIATTIWEQERANTVNSILSQIDCASNYTEEFTLTYDTREHHYTLYYYDQAGSLVQTVPPIGVNPVPAANFTNGVWDGTEPIHTHVTQYQYNTLGQVVWQNSPDGGETRFKYDHAQRLRFSQNAKQQNFPGNGTETYSFTKYDDEGRISAVGEMFANVNDTDLAFNNVDDNANDIDFPALNGGSVLPFGRTQTFYNTPDDNNADPNFVQTNLRGRVAETSNENMQTKYSYDEHGNVKELRHYYDALNINNQLNHDTQIEYDYDLISGNVKEVAFQKGQIDQFTHRYQYDADNRLTYVYTSDDGIVFDRDARYFYYQHGPLARVEVGTDNVQGMDYYYTLQGWIKGVNLPDLTGPGNEPGKDGIIGDGIPAGINRFVAKDEMAYTLGYHTQDYKPIETGVANGVLNSSTWSELHPANDGLYNGNIAWMVTDIDHFRDDGPLGTPTGNHNAMVYQYDQLHRITNATSFSKGANSNSWSLSGLFNSTYDYDANGNLKTLSRFAPKVDAGALAPELIDLMVYAYDDNNKPNQLTSINDNGNTSNLPYGDFKAQSANNYEYDEIGNLTKDNKEDIDEILWTVYGKVSDVKFTPGSGKTNIKYTYDPAGNRLTKKVGGTTTLYARDASGNVMGVYDHSPPPGSDGFITSQKEVPLYGSSRIGLQKFTDRILNGGTTPDLIIGSLRGQKYYEQSNHLGNILATVTDLKVGLDGDGDGITNSYEAQVTSATDYYAFGWEMPGRKYNSQSYRYGFNGKEKDDDGEFGSITNYDYGFRIYNPAVGRFLSVDPLTGTYPELTPYQFASNSPIASIDQDGLESYFFQINFMESNGESTLGLERKVDGALCNCFGKHLYIQYKGEMYYISSFSETINYLFPESPTFEDRIAAFGGRSEEELDAYFAGRKTIGESREDNRAESDQEIVDVFQAGAGGKGNLKTSTTRNIGPKTRTKKSKKKGKSGKTSKPGKTEKIERYMSKVEAKLSVDKNGLVLKPEPHHRQPKWVAKDGTRTRKEGLKMNKANTNKTIFTTQPGTIDWLKKNGFETKPRNEPGSFEIPAKKVKEFNEKVIKTETKQIKKG